MESTVAIFGHTACNRCLRPVLDEIAWKTDGLCADCFRADAAKHLDAAMVVVAGRERIVLSRTRSRRPPGVRAQRARARARNRVKPDIVEHRKTVAGCQARATARLKRLFPEIWEILLADERSEAGLAAWTIDRALTPHDTASSMEILDAYHALSLEKAS